MAELLRHSHYSVVAVVHRSLSQELAKLAARPPFRPLAETDVVLKRADLRDYGHAACALDGADAVIHLAAIPNPRADPPHVVYGTNTLSTWNVLQAAEQLGIRQVVLASSLNALGALFSTQQVDPEHFPLDEAHPTRAEDPYGLSKWVGEQIADGFGRRREVQIASIRQDRMLEPERMAWLAAHPQRDPRPLSVDFWGYVETSDCARAYVMPLDAHWVGHETFSISARDTSLAIPTRQAIETCYLGVPLKRELPGYLSVIDCSKAQRFYGWAPEQSWRQGQEV